MNCPISNTYITASDFAIIGDVARHCDLGKLTIAINEAKDFDLNERFCGYWDEILLIWDEINAYQTAFDECEEDPECEDPPVVPDDYADKLALICGGTFTGCNGKPAKHFGVKRVWLYYAYSRYLVLNGFNDTPNGSVAKTNDFSIPTPLKEVQQFADKYRTMGYESAKGVKTYVSINNNVFNFDGVVCLPCGCDGGCGTCHTKAKGYGIKGRVIYKQL